MERTIKFRGKRVSDGRWLYGYYYYKWRTSQNVIHLDAQQGVGVDNEFEVTPESVGQFTGLKDKNGKEIFEGDVIRRTISVPELDPVSYNEVISFVPGYFNSCKISDKNDTGSVLMEYHLHEIEVIGNVTDNPELIK